MHPCAPAPVQVADSSLMPSLDPAWQWEALDSQQFSILAFFRCVGGWNKAVRCCCPGRWRRQPTFWNHTAKIFNGVQTPCHGGVPRSPTGETKTVRC